MYHRNILRKVKSECVLHDVMLELTYACNLDCFFCYNDKQATGKALKLDQYIGLLDDLAGMQTLFVTLTGGEPLLHPDFFEIGRAANERGFVTRIKTGGHGLGGKIAKRLRDEVNPYMVEISIHGATAATHDRQTRVPGSFDYLVKNVPELKEIGLRPVLISTLTLWNENEVGEMYDLADKLGVTLRFQGPVGPRDDGDTEPLSIQPSAQGWNSYAEAIAQREIAPEEECGQGLEQDLEVQDASVGAEDGQPQPYCGTGSDGLLIDPFGNVYPCLRIRRSAGNLHEHSIRDIWSGSTVLPEVRQIAISTTVRVKAEGPLSNMGAPMFCPGLELMGCESGCRGCG